MSWVWRIVGALFAIAIILILWGVASQTGSSSTGNGAFASNNFHPGRFVSVLLLAVIVASVVGIFTLSGLSKIAAAAIATIVILLLAPTINQWWSSNVGGSQTQVVRVQGPCDGIKRRHHFGTEPGDPINPAGQCALDFWLPPGLCIYQKPAVIKVLGLGEAPTIGPLGNCPEGKGETKGPKDVEYTWSAGEPFDGFYMLSPPRYN
jgi:hypothetical protein